MNSEFIYQRSRSLAEHLLKLNVENDERRVEEAFWAAFGRGAKPEEVHKMLDFMVRYPVSQQGAEARLERWQGLWRVLLASSEFSYLNLVREENGKQFSSVDLAPRDASPNRPGIRCPRS